MGYLDGLAASSFKTDEKGNTVFFPWGILGKGYILPEDEKDIIRRSFKRHMILILTLAIACSLLFNIYVLVLGLALYYVGYAFWVNRLTKGLTLSTSTLTSIDARESAARAHDTATLWFFEIVSLLFVMAGIYVLIVVPQKWIVAMSSVLFGFIGVFVFWKTIKIKKEQDA